MTGGPVAPSILLVAVEDQGAPGFAARLALARAEDPREAARRTDVALRVVAVTLAWLVLLALLLGWGLTGPAGAERQVAALVAVVLPFVAAVIATKNGYVWLGGAYVVLTLVMVLPALGIAGLG